MSLVVTIRVVDKAMVVTMDMGKNIGCTKMSFSGLCGLPTCTALNDDSFLNYCEYLPTTTTPPPPPTTSTPTTTTTTTGGTSTAGGSVGIIEGTTVMNNDGSQYTVTDPGVYTLVKATPGSGSLVTSTTNVQGLFELCPSGSNCRMLTQIVVQQGTTMIKVYVKVDGTLAATITDTSTSQTKVLEYPFLYTDTVTGTEIIWKNGPSVDIRDKDGLVQK
jgi:hypothetical protein